jgi:hypothetical protein
LNIQGFIQDIFYLLYIIPIDLFLCFANDNFSILTFKIVVKNYPKTTRFHLETTQNHPESAQMSPKTDPNQPYFALNLGKIHNF